MAALPCVRLWVSVAVPGIPRPRSLSLSILEYHSRAEGFTGVDRNDGCSAVRVLEEDMASPLAYLLVSGFAEGGNDFPPVRPG